MWREFKLNAKSLVRSIMAAFANKTLKEKLVRNLQIKRQMKEFHSSPSDRRASTIESRTTIPGLLQQIRDCHIPLRMERIDRMDFEKWRKEFYLLDEQYKGNGDTEVEKVLEHYLSMRYLPVTKGEVLVDMAAASSIFADLLDSWSGVTAYKLDLNYPPGICANRIGADVVHSGLPDSFADILTFHCAFECLQGDADIRLVGEAERILKKDGRWGIVPLYLDQCHFVKMGPKNDRRTVKLSENESWVWRDDAFLASPFSRHYSPESFARRILSQSGAFDCGIIHFTNIEELERFYPGQRIYCHFLFRAQKK